MNEITSPVTLTYRSIQNNPCSFQAVWFKVICGSGSISAYTFLTRTPM